MINYSFIKITLKGKILEKNREAKIDLAKSKFESIKSNINQLIERDGLLLEMQSSKASSCSPLQAVQKVYP